jgi:hypothetical protein
MTDRAAATFDELHKPITREQWQVVKALFEPIREAKEEESA